MDKKILNPRKSPQVPWGIFTTEQYNSSLEHNTRAVYKLKSKLMIENSKSTYFFNESMPEFLDGRRRNKRSENQCPHLVLILYEYIFNKTYSDMKTISCI